MDIPILYKTNQFFFCEKPVGVASEGEKETDLPVLLEHQLHKPVYPVHRLDQGVGGVMVFALTKQAAAHLSRQVQQHTMEKEYWAVVTGVPEEPQGTFHDFLYRDAVKRKAFVVKKSSARGKRSRLALSSRKDSPAAERRFFPHQNSASNRTVSSNSRAVCLPSYAAGRGWEIWQSNQSACSRSLVCRVNRKRPSNRGNGANRKAAFSKGFSLEVVF